MVTPTVTMSQLGEAVVSDGPAKIWGSAGSAPSSSRVRAPFRQYIIIFTYFFFFLIDFVMLCLPSIRLASELIVHETLFNDLSICALSVKLVWGYLLFF